MIPCPTCDGMMCWDSGHCKKCWPGRPKYHEYAPLRGENPHTRKALADKKMSDKLAAEETAEKLSPAVTRLLNAALKNDEMGGVQKDTEWVYQNLMVLWRFIDVDQIPSPGSLALLVEAKKDKRWFLSNYHAKLLAITSKIDPDGWFEADDNQIEDAATECRQELARIAGEVDHAV